jgi:hypothetical protein
MELAPTGAWHPGLAALLIHDPEMKTAIIEVCNMRSVGEDPDSGETGVASKGNRTELFRSQTDRRWVEYVRDTKFQHKDGDEL